MKFARRLAIVILAALAACGDSASQVASRDGSSGASLAPSSRPKGPGGAHRLDRELRYSGQRVVPPPPEAQPRVSAQDAFAKNCKVATKCQGEAAPEMAFGLYTNDSYGTARPDGSLEPAFERRPVWVLLWENVECPAPGGGGNSPPAQRIGDPSTISSTPAPPALPTSAPPAPRPRCDAVTFIDADSGDFLLGIAATPE